MWHLPQVSGWRAWAAENVCRVWQAVQEPSEPSGLIRPMPVFGQVAGSSLPLGEHLHLGAVALPAAVDRGRGVARRGSPAVTKPAVALDDLGEHVVERAEDAAGLGVVRAGELLDLLASGSGRSPSGLTMVAIELVVVEERVGVALVGGVALVAADVGPEVLAGSPHCW